MQIKNQKSLVTLTVYAIIVALLISSFIAYFSFSNNEVQGNDRVLDLSVTPDGQTFMLDVNESQTFTAYSSKASVPVFTWQLVPSGNLIIAVNGENQQLTNGSIFKVTGQKLILNYPFATQEYISVNLSVKDNLGYSGNLLRPLMVADPYTDPGVVNNASTADYSYMIETDGSGWYRAINGTNGSIVSGWTTSNDATSTIQNALTAIAASGYGGIIEFGSGKFYCDNLKISGNIQLRGQGYVTSGTSTSTQLIQNGPGNLLYFVDSTIEFAFVISNMMVRGNTALYSTGSGLYVAPAVNGQFNDVHLSDVFFFGFPAYGIYTTCSWGWMLSNCIVEYNCANNTADYGVYLGTGGGQGTIISSKILSNYGGGIYSTCNNALISDNQICLNDGVGVYIAGPFTIFSSNTVSFNLDEGLYISNGGASTTISSNNFIQNGGSSTSQMEAATSSCTISSNIFDGNDVSGYGLKVDSGSGASMVVNNIFKGGVGTFFGFQNAIFPNTACYLPATIYRDNSGLNLPNAPATSLFWINRVGYIMALGYDYWYGAGNETSTWTTGQTYTVTGFDVTVYLSGGGPSTTVMINGKTIISATQITTLSIPASIGTSIKITDATVMPTITIIPVSQ